MSASPSAGAAATPRGPRVLVVGAGVVGLTTALCLHESGYEVTVVADRFAPDLTSVVAGALWEWPPAVCGRHGDPRSLDRSKRWCMVSYRKFKELAAAFGEEETGVHLRQVYFYFNQQLEDEPFELGKMKELAGEVDDFEHGLHIVPAEIERGFRGGIRDAYRHMAPMVDTDVYLAWLLERVEARGIRVVAGKIAGNLIDNEEALLRRFAAAAIVNCAGLGALAISGDTSTYPLRGALVRLLDERREVTAAHCIARASSSTPEQNIVFIVPRGRQGLVLGGLVQKDQWATDLSLDHPLIRQMYEGCLDFLPLLRSLPIDAAEPVRTGLRPFTRDNVCVESVPGCRIVHNYGHGGAGVTLSWGCAEEVVARIGAMLRPPPARPPAAESRRAAAETIFVVHREPPVEADFRRLGSPARRLVLLASRAALAHLVPAQYHHFDAIELLETFDADTLAAACRRHAGATRWGLATADPHCDPLVAELRARLADLPGAAGGPPRPRVAGGEREAPAGPDEPWYSTVAVFERGRPRYFAAGRLSGDPGDFLRGRPVGCRLLPEDDAAGPSLRRFTDGELESAAGGAALHGVYHLVCRVPSGSDRPVAAHREAQPPPAPISRLLELCHGIELDALHLEAQLGDRLEIALLAPGDRRHGGCAWHPPRPGVVARISRPEVRGELEASWRIYPGARLAAPAGAGDIATYFVVRHHDPELVRADSARLAAAFFYDLAPTGSPT